MALWKTVGGSEARYGDLHAMGLEQVLGVAAHSGGKLVSDPPDGVELATVLQVLHSASTLTGTDAWPDPLAGDGATRAAYTQASGCC